MFYYNVTLPHFHQEAGSMSYALKKKMKKDKLEGLEEGPQ